MAANSILIADAGSTKTDWALLRRGFADVLFSGPGINVATMSAEERDRQLGAVLTSLECRPDAVRFFGAGCASQNINDSLAEDISVMSGAVDVEVASDMTGAALSLAGDDTAVVCILGTGSNACKVENGRVVDSIPSLGYVLGDEGSGNALGRRFCSDLMKRRLSDTITKKAVSELGITVDEVIHRVYRSPGANAWLASFVPFLAANQDDSSISELIDSELESFICRCVLPLCETETKVGFVGSIAAVFESRLRSIIGQYGLELSGIERKPIKGLIRYYSEKLK